MRHPAKYLILDRSHPWTQETSNILIPAVQNVLSLASHMKGESRIPAFGFSTAELYYDELQPVSLLKGNVDAILKSLDSACKMDTGANLSWKYRDFLEYAICNILKSFASKCDENVGNLNWPTEIHIVIITRMKAVSQIANILTDLVSENILPRLKRIDVIHLVTKPDNPDEKTPPHLSECFEFGRIIVTRDSPSDLELLLKDWLTEEDTRQEHLRIKLDRSLSIKCDISDCILSPLNLPFGHRFSLTNDCFVSANATVERSVFELGLVERINISGICSTFFFGRTKKLFPTRTESSSVDLKTNEQIFKALCVELNKSEQGLLAKLRFGTKNEIEMSTYFLISSDGENFFLNNIAPSELLLPELRSGSREETPEIPEEITSVVTQCLEKIPSSEEYFPEKYSSCLYERIQTLIKEPTPSKPKDHIIVTHTPRKPAKRQKSPTELVAGLEPGDYVPECVKKIKKDTPKKQKCNKEELNVMHPALLSPKIKAKYRKKSNAKVYEAFEPSDEL